MDNLHSLIVVLSVLAALFVPQLLVMFYVVPRNSESETHEFDYR